MPTNMTNEDFLDVIKHSFETYLKVGTSRSTAKLKELHGHIAYDISRILGDEYEIISQGYGDDKEGAIDGRYYPKNVDITIKRNDKAVAGFAVKFVMRNYSQNSNNYFEGMLGETANIRANAIPYFQIFVIFDKVPYYKSGGTFKKYDIITNHNLSKYVKLSEDNPLAYMHTPDKTLIVVVSLKEKAPNYVFRDEDEYAEYYLSVIKDDDLLKYSNKIEDKFSSSVILNDYENYIDRCCSFIKGKQK